MSNGPTTKSQALDAVDHWINVAILRYGADPEEVQDTCDRAVEWAVDEKEAADAAS